MKIILEGPDCAGKTTLANSLKGKLTDYLYIHHGQYKHSYAPHMESLKLRNVIIDRHWPSELIYSTIFRSGPVYNVNIMEYEARRDVNTKFILCLPPKSKVLARFEERKQHGGEDFESVAKVYDAYVLLKNMYPYFTIYNYAEMTADEFIKKEIYEQK
jgi:thymidylate kinase